MAEQKTQEQAPVQEKEIKISDLLSLLDQGKDRKQIAKIYGVTLATMKQIFTHPKLKGRKVKPRTPYQLIDDVEEKAPKAKEAGAAATSVATEQAQVPTPQAPTSEAAGSGAAGATNPVW